MQHPNLHVVEHPLIKHYLYHIRDVTTKPALFRTLTRKLTFLLAAQAAQHIDTIKKNVQTPLENTVGEVIESEIIIIPILRAGLGMLEAVVELFPSVNVGYIGIQRNHNAEAEDYYCKLPKIKDKIVFIADPMLATGGSISKTIDTVKAHEPKLIIVMTVLAVPEGVKQLEIKHPDVIIYTAALDRQLNEKKYILPGVGDFGDRLYGTEH